MELKEETKSGIASGKINIKLQRFAIFLANTYFVWCVVMLALAQYLFGYEASCFVGFSILLSFLIGYGWRLRDEPEKAKMITALHHAHKARISEF